MPEHLNNGRLGAALHDLDTGASLVDIIHHSALGAGKETVIIPQS